MDKYICEKCNKYILKTNKSKHEKIHMKKDENLYGITKVWIELC